MIRRLLSWLGLCAVAIVADDTPLVTTHCTTCHSSRHFSYRCPWRAT